MGTSLSEQQFVDCDKVDQGCNGGLMDNAFKFAEKNAICTESSYPYKGRGGTCEASSCTVGIPNGDVKGYKDVPEGTTATPQCVLQDSSSGDKYCALTCLIGGCPPGASCKHSGLTGLCLYPQANSDVKQLELADSTLISV